MLRLQRTSIEHAARPLDLKTKPPHRTRPHSFSVALPVRKSSVQNLCRGSAPIIADRKSLNTSSSASLKTHASLPPERMVSGRLHRQIVRVENPPVTARTTGARICCASAPRYRLRNDALHPEHLFEPFYNTTKGTGQRAGGLRFGLHLWELSGALGWMNATSLPDVVTEFRCLLPSHPNTVFRPHPRFRAATTEPRHIPFRGCRRPLRA